MELQLETTSTCNAACSWCVYPTSKRWGGLMSMDLFRKIIDESTRIPQINKYILHGLGEPLLDPKLQDRIWYVSQVRPRAAVQIYTNGVYLTPENFDNLRGAGLTSVVISLNAVRPEQHEAIMGLKGKFEEVCGNIEGAIKNQGETHIAVHAVVNGDQFTNRDVIGFYQRWGETGYGGHGKCITEGNWAGDNRTTRTFKPNEACHRALDSIYVLYDGRVTTCCFDPDGKQVFGNLSQETIRQVYNSGDYMKFREAHHDDRADEYDICRGCTRI